MTFNQYKLIKRLNRIIHLLCVSAIFIYVMALLAFPGGTGFCDKETIIFGCVSASTTPPPAGTGTPATPATVDFPTEVHVSLFGDDVTFSLNKGLNVGNLVKTILGLLISLVGAFAFISLMIAGVQYITAGGDNGKTEKAKKTIIQAIIAILIVAFSYSIFRIVLSLL